MSVSEHFGKSAHALRAELRKANIDKAILERKLASALKCVEGIHKYFGGQCITCGHRVGPCPAGKYTPAEREFMRGLKPTGRLEFQLERHSAEVAKVSFTESGIWYAFSCGHAMFISDDE
ncbi:hypothetical protein SEA_FINNY_53 [Microbacterium phage Finny]|uniref:Uncharacterized protein n=2 Tax=Elerivirus eleri TaxID=2560589 RepID=A0A514U436_9CAUD|nr:hypothetical protein SEA_FINNY_53 [Microbacterium phage Finny]QDK03712.1 hypothetical protein SEA_MCUBED_52 [Microbacterium phage MCubed]WNN93853.1 hypothetical protein SEA_ZENITSU_52 [Microbacterium phage Zenitsu]